MSKYTPGPWNIFVGPADLGIYACDQTEDTEHVPQIATVHDKGFSEATATANANVLAAAPEMLEALKDLMELINSGYLIRNIDDDGKPDWALRQVKPVMMLNKAAAAIAKADGG